MKEKQEKKKNKLITDLIKKLIESLAKGIPTRKLEVTLSEWDILRTFNLLTSKPMLYLCNVKENEISGNKMTNEVFDFASKHQTSSFIVSAFVEEEISTLSRNSKDMSKEELLQIAGIKESSIAQVLRESKKLIGLENFYTAGEKEARAWNIKKGTNARDASGEIHSDMAKGFIRCEIIPYVSSMITTFT